MGATYTKTDLLRELAQSARISRRRVEAVLDALTLAAYREAKQSFAVPGICRLDVVHRKARQIRNPQTGEILMIAEHDALRVRPVKRARDAVAPTPRALVQQVPAPSMPCAAATATPAMTRDISPAAAGAPLPAPPFPSPMPSPEPALPPALPAVAPSSASTPPATPPAVAPDAAAIGVTTPIAPASAATPPPVNTTTSPASEGEFLSFCCKDCGQEIEAPVDMAGNPSECPTCGASLIVPYLSEPGTIWDHGGTTTHEKPKPDTQAIEAMKGRTIRIDLADDL